MTQLDEPKTMRWTLQEYHQAIEAGIFNGRRIQLLDGEIIEMAPQRDEHAFAIRKADIVIRRVFKGACTFCIQLPMTIVPRGEPEPDLAVLQGPPESHRTHPTTALLVIEVSDTTLSIDRNRKAPLYAQANVKDYWIVNLIDRCVEVHRTPVRDRASRRWRYDDVKIYGAKDSISPLAMPKAKVMVKSLLP